MLDGRKTLLVWGDCQLVTIRTDKEKNHTVEGIVTEINEKVQSELRRGTKILFKHQSLANNTDAPASNHTKCAANRRGFLLHKYHIT